MVTSRHLQLLLLGVIVLVLQQVHESQQADYSGNIIAEGFFVLDRKSLDIYITEEGSLAKAKTAAIEDLKFWLTEVNTMYETLRQYGLNIQLRIAGIQVLDYNIYKADGISTKDALAKFSDFLVGSKSSLYWKKYDFAVLLTGFRISQTTGGGAISKSMCLGNLAYAVVEATGVMQSAINLAHEIGHMFGSMHDTGSTIYIMSPVQEPSLNPAQFTFSAESANYIKAYLGAAKELKCLRTTSSSSTIPNVTPDSYTGRAQNAEVVCKRSYGEASRVCTAENFYSGHITGDRVCGSIACRNPIDLTDCSYAIPTDGMPCAKDMACRFGRCVADKKPSTENVDSSCLWGDDPFPDGKAGVDCTQLLTKYENRGCSNTPQVRTGCCATCNKYKTGNPACPYGDLLAVNVGAGPQTCGALLNAYGKSTICNHPQLQPLCCGSCL